MLGVVNKAIEEFVITVHGGAVWQEVLRDIGTPGFRLEPMLMYEDEKSYALIRALSKRLSKPQQDILDDIGTYLVTPPNGGALRRLLRFSGSSFDDFLFSLDDLNDRVDLALPDLQLPQIMVIPQTIDRVHVRVSQTWSGFAYVLQGLLRAMADDYGTLVFLDVRRDITDSACIEVILIENNFSAGIDFDMVGGAR
jgi:hypothetical protein